MVKTPKLHELLAVLPDTAVAAQTISVETMATFSKKADHFKGQIRDVKFFTEARESENVSDSKELVTTVHEKLDHTATVLSRHYDALLQMEEANGRARADLTVDGMVLMADIPATFLLGMEKRLKQLQDLLLTMPTLEPAVKWEPDPGRGAGIYVSAPTVQMKTEKTLQHKILVAATDKHPAQVEKWNEDVPVARIETTHISGMLTPAEKALIITRVGNLMAAVKKARQRANDTDVKDLRVGKRIFEYLLTGV